MVCLLGKNASKVAKANHLCVNEGTGKCYFLNFSKQDDLGGIPELNLYILKSY